MLATVLYISINTLSNIAAPTVRLDVTEERLYTLSQGTHKILNEIDEPIQLHLFISERLGREVPFYAAYGRRVRELLVEIAATSNGKVLLHEHNPEPFSDGENLAVSFGVQGIPVDQGDELAYFGLAGINSVDQVEFIPFFQPTRKNLLEYDFVRMIHTLSNFQPTVMGIMSSLPVMGDMSTQMQGDVLVPWAIAKRLKENFDTINLPGSIDTLPPEIGVMMVVHPRLLAKRTIYELEQFLFRGGRAILFIDPKAETDISIGTDSVSTSADGLQPLFRHWGIQVPDGQLVGDKSMALRVNAGSAARPMPADFLVWINVPPNNMAPDDPVTSHLPPLHLASAGFIIRKDDSPLTMAPLIFSSANSSPIAVADVSGLHPDVFGLLEAFQPDPEIYVMAARLSGEVTTAFPSGPPPRTIKKTAQYLAQHPETVQLMKSVEPINIILVADSDLLEDRFWLNKQQFFGREVEEPIAGNADFVINALGNLAGGDNLLTLRSRGISLRPFEKVREIQQQAEHHFQNRERALMDKLKEARNKVAALEGVRKKKDPVTGKLTVDVSLTDQQRAEVEALRLDMISIRKQLREVQRGLREDVERLEAWLQFVNIGLIPMIIASIAIAFSGILAVRNRRRYVGHREELVT